MEFFFVVVVVGEPPQSYPMVGWVRSGATAPFYCQYTLHEPALTATNTPKKVSKYPILLPDPIGSKPSLKEVVLYDDLAVTVNDAAPCSVLCVMPDKISFKTFNISVSHSSGLLVRVCLYVWFQHLAFPYQGLNGLKTFWNGKEVNLSISTMSTYIDRV